MTPRFTDVDSGSHSASLAASTVSFGAAAASPIRGPADVGTAPGVTTIPESLTHAVDTSDSALARLMARTNIKTCATEQYRRSASEPASRFDANDGGIPSAKKRMLKQWHTDPVNDHTLYQCSQCGHVVMLDPFGKSELDCIQDVEEDGRPKSSSVDGKTMCPECPQRVRMSPMTFV